MKYILDIPDGIGECETAVVSGSEGLCFVNMKKLTAEERTGRWIVVDEQEPRRYGCSECKRLVWQIENYCPNCGARMEVQE